MKLKVCGMREKRNIRELIAVSPDYVGFIFYDKSPRYAGDSPVAMTEGLSAVRVGVFVNPTEAYVVEMARAFHLDLIQLHGDEPIELIKKLKLKGLRIMKVFRVMDRLPLDEMRHYEPFVEFFLFDTRTPAYGGSGKKFEWSILEAYNMGKPFFLSGGIGLEDISAIQQLKNDKLFAIDVNSRFETAPGVKDIEKLKELRSRMISAEG